MGNEETMKTQEGNMTKKNGAKRVISLVVLSFLLVVVSFSSIPIEGSEYHSDENEVIIQALCDLAEFEHELSWAYQIKMVERVSLISPGDADFCLIKFYDEEAAYLGYCIWDNFLLCVVELSEGENPYEIFFEGAIPVRAKLKYNEAYYSVEYMGIEYYLDVFGYEYFSEPMLGLDENMPITPMGILPGVKHNLQGNSNCVATALTNVLYYWSQHGYPNLGMGMSFKQMRDRVNLLFNYTFENNRVPYVLDEYVEWTTHNEYTVNSEVKRYPSINYLTSEIDNKRPCMLGFAAGEGSYSKGVGHMTMCYGYVYPGDGSYLVVLADGHSDNAVYKKWNSRINDYVIAIRFSK